MTFNVERARYNMIEQQIRPWEVLDQGVLSLLSMVRREEFVPARWRELAFADMEVPLVDGGSHGRVMLAPKVEARILQELHVQREDKVLEVGAGSGHMAALLAYGARQVFTLEIDDTLVPTARQNLARAGVHNVSVVHVDGCLGLPAQAPFDVIVLSGSVAQVPPVLLDQLKVGGRLAAVVGQLPIMRAVVHTRVAADQWREQVFFETVAPRLLGFAEPNRFSF